MSGEPYRGGVSTTDHVRPTWVTAFLDNSAQHHLRSVDFWRTVTRTSLSQPRGDDGEFATLMPLEGDPYLKVQRLGAGPDRVHVDLHVTDPRVAADRAIALGATELTFVGIGYVVLTSPGGLHFCFVPHPELRKPPPTPHPGGHLSRVHQVSIDVPAAEYDREVVFWEGLTGWEPRQSGQFPEFRFLGPPEGQPLGILLQRLDEASGPTRAHLDWGCTDRAAETQRHLKLGATVVAEHPRWTVLRDPVGRAYCLTDGDPT